MKRTMSLMCLFTLAAVLFFSCGKTDPLANSDDGSSEEEISLEKEFGGYESNDESVAFGDTELLLETVEDEDVSDTYASDAVVVDALAQDGDTTAIKAYFLRITYGLLAGDTTATEVVDWSGSAEVNKGTLVVLKKIRFESNDFIHLPRSSRQLVEFTSQTKPHFDGMVFAIIDNDTTDLEGTFTFNAGSYSKIFTFSELDSLELLEAVGGNGHEVSILARCKEYIPFAGGFITGRWIKTEPHGGIFKGRWINSLGFNGGHLRGIWGINRAGNRVFKGKYINFNGDFRGLIEGQWGYERGTDGGFLRGRWVNRALDTVGIIRGKFRAGRPGDRRGYFHARYRVRNHDNSEGTD